MFGGGVGSAAPDVLELTGRVSIDNQTQPGYLHARTDAHKARASTDTGPLAFAVALFLCQASRAPTDNQSPVYGTGPIVGATTTNHM